MGLEGFFQECKKIDDRLLKLQMNPDFTTDDNRRVCFGILRSQMNFCDNDLKYYYQIIAIKNFLK